MKKRDNAQEYTGDELLGAKLRQLTPRQLETPETLEAQVFSSLDTLQFLADVTSLFTIQFIQAELEVLDAFTAPAGRREEE